MALFKEITLPKGFVLTYHKIRTLVPDYYRCVTGVAVDSFVSKELRDASEDPRLIATPLKDYEFDGVDHTRADIYEMLKALPEWADAVDA